MTPVDDTNDSNTHVANTAQFGRIVFIYWATTLAVAILVTGTFVYLMGFVRDWVN
ncbi:MAG: hypothetical protein ABI443_03445 [Chthoniobacterales bacterium]